MHQPTDSSIEPSIKLATANHRTDKISVKRVKEPTDKQIPTGEDKDKTHLDEIAEMSIDDESSLLTYSKDKPIDAFSQLELSPEVLEGIEALGWKKPTEVQALCLPATLRGENVVGFAQTGTGKTGVFLITLAQKLFSQIQKTNPKSSEKYISPPGVILAPTRELAMQIHDECQRFLAPLKIHCALIFGGVDYEKQIQTLKKQPHIIVATPGRLRDFISRKEILLTKTSFFICDEVDRMFDIGFLDDVEFFFQLIDDNAQKLMFSATTSDSLQELCFKYIKQPQFLSVAHPDIAPESIDQKAILCSTDQKLRVFMGLLRSHEPKRAIIFTNTKITAFWLHYKLSHNGFETDLITGDLAQNKRIALIRKIKAGKIRFLIATDVASRGLHIADISHVYNFDLPTEPANYIHRIGRTARAGATGKSYSLVCDEYGSHLLTINKLLKTDVPCEWFDEEYLTIEDLSDDPFLNKSHKPTKSPHKASNSPHTHRHRTSPTQKSRHSQRNNNFDAQKKTKTNTKKPQRHKQAGKNNFKKQPNKDQPHKSPKYSQKTSYNSKGTARNQSSRVQHNKATTKPQAAQTDHVATQKQKSQEKGLLSKVRKTIKKLFI
ncbi:MAG: DEAD/DEAH box helicase [Proteobacteria bacterium]|nr:DEAD/DEAH box helicase [Pseudomonadota bacterium]